MQKNLLTLIIFLFGGFSLFAQNLTWQLKVDTSTTFSSPRAVHLNGDSIADIVIGGGLDGLAEQRGVVAVDGQTGALLWNFPTQEEIFASAQFMDITGDNIKDIFIGGRYAECYAINGATGQMIWEFFPGSPTQAVDSAWFNIYSMQFVPDQNADNVPDLLASCGGNHALPPWDTLRDPGYLLIIDAMTGNVIAMDTMPDGEETYCSPVVADLDNNGVLDIVYGSGGENDKGSLWRTTLPELRAGDISQSIELLRDPNLGFIAPASLADMNADGYLDIISQAYNGRVRVYDGQNNKLLWSYYKSGVESSNSPVIGNFTGDQTPDVLLVLSKGSAPSFFDFYQVLLDGSTGQVTWMDSIGMLHYSAPSAADLNGDGRDEAVFSVTERIGSAFYNQLVAVDFETGIQFPLHVAEPGVNLGASPLIQDLDADGLLDIVYAHRADSLNPMGRNGFILGRLSTNYQLPYAGVAWGAYMGTNFDGVYNNTAQPCTGMQPKFNRQNLSCNGTSDGKATVIISGQGYNYLWSDGNITDSLVGASAGRYTLRITDSIGCYIDTFVDFQDPYVITFGGLAHPTCRGDSTGRATVNSSGCPCSFSGCLFSWSNGSNIKTAMNLPSGYNYVTITHPDGCIVTDSVLIFEPASLVDSVHIQDQQCARDTQGTGAIEVFVSNGVTMTWDNQSTAALQTQLDTGWYMVTLKNPDNCKERAYYYVAEVDSVQLQLTADSTSCAQIQDGGISSLVQGGYPTYTYLWSNGDSTAQISQLEAGMYFLTVSDSAGCNLVDSVRIGAPDSLSATYTLTEFTANQNAIDVQAIGGIAPYTYEWDGILGTNPHTNLLPGTYVLRLRDQNNCSLVDSITLQGPLTTTVDVNNSAVVRLYPNPVQDVLKVDLAGEEIDEVILYNALGQELRRQRIQGEQILRIPVKEIEAGLYFISLNKLGETLVNKQFIKQ